MKKTILLIVLMMAVFMFTACEGETTTITGEGYIGGSNGLEIKFANNAPPPNVAGNNEEEFAVIIGLTNKGEYEIPKEKVKITLSGFPPMDFSTTPAELTIIPVENIPRRYKAGDGTIINAPEIPAEFSLLRYTKTEATSREFPFKIDVCYDYKTRVAAELCIKEDFNSDRDGDLCEVSSIRKFSSSGAPIQVTSLSQASSGRDRTTFTFNVKNQDTGKVYRPDNSCEETNVNRDKVHVEIIGFDDASNVICNGLLGGTTRTNGYITVTDAMGTDVSCSYTPIQKSPRIQPFTIVLSYDYKSTIQTNVNVQATYE